MSPERPCVLVVEDDPMIRELIRTRLEIAGYDCRWASTGRDALDACMRGQFRVMVLDVNLPDFSGFDVLKRLSNLGRTPPPTLMLTARHAVEDVQRAVSLGAKDYLTKPFDDAQLLQRVARLLRAPRATAAPPARPPRTTQVEAEAQPQLQPQPAEDDHSLWL